MFLEFNNLSIKYGEKTVVENINLGVPKGKIVTLVGKNGTGKSSILKTLTNSVKDFSGEIYLNEKNINTYTRKEVARGVAILPQIFDCPADIDVETLVSYGRYPYKKFGKKYSSKDKEIVEEVLKLTNLELLRYRKLGSLSGGERQRARIAMAICQQPKILILDEPTTYLDISYQIEILKLVSTINKEMNMSILMVLHDLNLASKYSDIIYVLNEGKVYRKGGSKEIICEEILNNVFKIDVEIWENNPSGKPYFIPLDVIKK